MLEQNMAIYKFKKKNSKFHNCSKILEISQKSKELFFSKPKEDKKKITQSPFE